MKLPEAIAAILPTDWTAKLDQINQQVQETAARRGQALTERDEVLVAAVTGDAVAQKRANALETEVSDLDKKLERLYAAAEQCTNRLAAEEVSRLKAAEARQCALSLKLMDARQEYADTTLDRLAEQFAKAANKFAAMGLEAYAALPRRDNDQHNTVLSAQNAEHAVRVALFAHGLRWALPYAPPKTFTIAEEAARQNGVIRNLLDNQ